MNKPLTQAQAHANSWATLRDLIAFEPAPRRVKSYANAIANTASYLLVDGAAQTESERRGLVGLIRSCARLESGGTSYQSMSQVLQNAREELA